MVSLTPEATEALLRARWTADPETEGTLDYIVRTLTTPESDGASMIERSYKTCEYRNQRNAEVWAAGSAFLQKRFKDKAVYFAVDCPDEGYVTFHLAISDSARDLHSTPQAHRSWNLNLLKPKDEWIIPPIEMVPEPAPNGKPEPIAVNARPKPQSSKPAPQREKPRLR